MSTAPATAPASSDRAHRPPAGVRPLARIEAARLARHPVFVVGVLLGIFFTGTVVQEMTGAATADQLAVPVAAMTVGTFAMIAGHLLTRSFDRADELVQTAPTSPVRRTAALCVSAVVPAIVATLWLLLHGMFERGLIQERPAWIYGTFSHADLWAVVIGNTVVAAVGGTLLGIAAGRWWRFRGSTVALVLVVTVWTVSVIGLFSNEGTPLAWYRWVRLLTPVSYFHNTEPNGIGSDTLTGSPWWYLAWLVTLCALAAIAALLKGSESSIRRRLVRLVAAMLAASVVTYGLAAAGGNSHSVRTYPDGHSVVLIP